MNNIDRTAIGLGLFLSGCKSFSDFLKEDISKVSQDLEYSSVSPKRSIYETQLSHISEESTPEQVDALVHKIMDANITLENVLTKENDITTSDWTILLNNHEINQAEAVIYEVARHSTYDGLQDVLSTSVSTEVNGKTYSLFMDVKRDKNRILTYSYSEYLAGNKQEIAGRDGVKKVLYKILKTAIETKDLENKTQDAPIEVPEVKQPEKMVKTDTNYNSTDLTIAGLILASSLGIYLIGRKLGYFRKE